METEEVLRDMVKDFPDRWPDGREVVDYVDRRSPPNWLGTSARLYVHHPRVGRAVRRLHDLDSARARLLPLYQGLVGLMGLPKARLIRVVADVGMQAESELSVSMLDL
jgi:hypothetical protein